MPSAGQMRTANFLPQHQGTVIVLSGVNDILITLRSYGLPQATYS